MNDAVDPALLHAAEATGSPGAEDGRLLDAVHGEPAVQEGAAAACPRRGHALLGRPGPPDPGRRRRPVVRQRRPCAAAHRGGDPAAGGRTGLRAAVPDGPPEGLRTGRARGRRSRPRAWQGVLHQFGLRGGRDGAEDGAGLPPRARRRHAHPAHRPRARLPRRQFRRHLGRRHGRQPQDVRPPVLPGVDHIRHTHDPARNAFSVGQPVHGAELADDLERLVALHDASNIAAVIVEPVAGSTGVLVPPEGYLQRLREICTKHGILLDLRRGHHRLRPHRAAFRDADLRRHAGHDHLRQGHHQRLRADGRGARARRTSTTPS